MENGDLEKQPKQQSTVMNSVEAGVVTAEPAADQSAESESAVVALEPVTKESLWQRLRNQPRETAAIVVLVVTAIIWLDSGNSTSNQSQASKSLDPMDGFESYFSDFETTKSGTPLRESADPVDPQSSASFGDKTVIPHKSQAEFASTITANYGDSTFEPGNISSDNQQSTTTAAQYPGSVEVYSSPESRTYSGGAGLDINDSSSEQNRRVRFAGRIQPAN